LPPLTDIIVKLARATVVVLVLTPIKAALSGMTTIAVSARMKLLASELSKRYIDSQGTN